MKKTHVTGLLCVTTLVLAACGGGGGGSSGSVPSTPSETTGDPTGETPSGDETPDAGMTPDVEPQASATDRICTSHTSTTHSTVGNSLLAFDADPGQCFGVKQAVGNGKRLIRTGVSGDSAAASGGVLNAEAEGRLTTNVYESGLGEGMNYTFVVDVSNSGSRTACVESEFLNHPIASILDLQGERLGQVRLKMLGDQYQAPTAGAPPKVFTGCVPAGETRTALGSWLDTDADIDPAVIASYDRVELSLDVAFPGADAERAADLIPTELSWTASALTGESTFVAGRFQYTTSASILNTSMQNMRLSSSLATVAYIDADGYLTGTDVVWVGEFLGKDDDELTPDELTIAPAGGMLSLASRDTFVADVDGRSDGYRGPATRALLHVERCFDEGCGE